MKIPWLQILVCQPTASSVPSFMQLALGSAAGSLFKGSAGPCWRQVNNFPKQCSSEGKGGKAKVVTDKQLEFQSHVHSHGEGWTEPSYKRDGTSSPCWNDTAWSKRGTPVNFRPWAQSGKSLGLYRLSPVSVSHHLMECPLMYFLDPTEILSRILNMSLNITL